MSAGAHAVKLEGVRGHAEIVRHIVMGSAGDGTPRFTPQSINMLGGMQVQAQSDEAAKILSVQARELQDIGLARARMRAF